MPARAATTTQWRGGLCTGGTLVTKIDGTCDLVFHGCRFDPSPAGASAASSARTPPTTYQWRYSSVTKAKTARRMMCRRLGRMRNEWRYWPGDASHSTIQMKVSKGKTVAILFSKERLHVVARNVWGVMTRYIRTRGSTINTARGENRITIRRYTDPKPHQLVADLYPEDGEIWDAPVPADDADGFANYDFRRWYLQPRLA